MSRRRRLLWKLYPTYLLVILLCSAAVVAYTVTTVRDFYHSHLENDLQARAKLVSPGILNSLTAGRLQGLQTDTSSMAQAIDTRITLINTDGKVLADSHEDPGVMDNHARRPEVAEAMQGRVGQSIRHSNTLDADMMYVAIPLRDGDKLVGVVRTALPLTDIQATLDKLYLGIALSGLVVALLAALIALLISRWLSRPFEQMTAGAERFARGDLGEPLNVPARSLEIDNLADALNRMAAQLGEKISTITRQQTEQAAVLASMVEGVLAVDVEQRVISLNDAVANLLGQEVAGAQGRDLRELVRNVQLEKLVTEVLGSGQTREGEVTIRGEHDRILQVHGTPLRDGQDRQIGAVMVFNDITKLRRLESIRRDFVANVSHELKTPITSIKGFVETLREGNVDDPERARHFLDIISTQADRLNAIIEDLLSLSRIEQEADKGDIRLSPGQVRAAIDGALQVCQIAADAKNITMDVKCDEDLKAQMNQPLLEQAITNLIDNALKYSEPSSAVLIEAGKGNGEVLLSVRDWGSGISAEHLPRLFERFYRVDKARSRKLGGTGLGLAIVKHIASSHRAHVTVESTPGEGSTFTLHMQPAAAPEPASRAEQPKKPE